MVVNASSDPAIAAAVGEALVAGAIGCRAREVDGLLVGAGTVLSARVQR